jgi:hypothetical protein
MIGDPTFNSLPLAALESTCGAGWCSLLDEDLMVEEINGGTLIFVPSVVDKEACHAGSRYQQGSQQQAGAAARTYEEHP